MSLRAILFTLIPKTLNGGRQHYHNFKILTRVNQHNVKMSANCHNHTKAIKCWQCGIERKNLSELFCEQCNFIQAPQDDNNYFKLFELNEHFDIDQKQLTLKYRQLQSLLHPDKFTNKSDEEKSISEDFSSLVNKAYNTLQTPLKRALHLLHLRGEVFEEDHRVDDPDFLMQIMELNEEVENAETDQRLLDLKKENEEELSKIGESIKKAFDNKQIDEAKANIAKMKYYNSVNNHINNLIREKGVTV